jgi:hypothetical protein
MTPEKKPFFAATYIPRETRFSMMGILTLLPRITQMWKKQRTDLIRSGDRVIAAIASAGTSSSGTKSGVDLMDDGYQSLLLLFDPANGGFGNAPKFPTPHTLLFLLRYAARNGDSRALKMVEKTLNAIRNGGIYDHLGEESTGIPRMRNGLSRISRRCSMTRPCWSWHIPKRTR